jgi:hypothetical protein
MNRRDFLARSCAGLAALSPALSRIKPPAAAPWLLVPMDGAERTTSRRMWRSGCSSAQARGWFLNYRSGAFLLPADAAARDAALNSITARPLDDGR